MAQEKHLNRLFQRYLLALSLIALLALFSQYLIHRSLANQEMDSKVVNIAGRQRMFSQKVVKLALLISGDTDLLSQKNNARTLREVITQWQQSYLGLRTGNSDLGIPQPGTNPTIGAAFDQLDPYYQAMVGAARALVEHPYSRETYEQSIPVLLSNEQEYLQRMDQIVDMYEALARRKIDRTHLIQSTILIVTLLTLVAEGRFIFMPANHQLEAFVANVQENRNRLRKTIQAIPHPFLVIKKEGGIQYANPEFEQLFACASDDIKGKSLEHVLPELQKELDNEPKLAYLLPENAGHQLRTIRTRHKDGRQLTLIASLNCFQADGDKYLNVLLQDITEFQEKRNLILAQEEALSDIAWRHSHEVRKPVANILGLVQLLTEDNFLENDERNEYLAYLRDSALELDDTVREIIQHSPVRDDTSHSASSSRKV